MSKETPIYPAIVYQARIQTRKDGESLVRGGKARIATAKDGAIAGVNIDKSVLTAGQKLQSTLDEETKTKAAALAASKAPNKTDKT